VKVLFHDGDIRLRLCEEDLSCLNKGIPVSSTTPMLHGEPLEISLILDSLISEVAVHAVHREVEFRFPPCAEIAAVLSSEAVGHAVELMTSEGPLLLTIERDLGRGMHLEGKE